MKKYIIFMLYIIILSFFLSCNHLEHIYYEPNVNFVDSTYTQDKESYKIGEIIGVVACESIEADMPDTVEILIESRTGDFEIIKAFPFGAVFAIPQYYKCHSGFIQSNATDSITQKNGIIEVHPEGDTLHAIYKINKFIIVFDDAVIDPFQ